MRSLFKKLRLFLAKGCAACIAKFCAPMAHKIHVWRFLPSRGSRQKWIYIDLRLRHQTLRGFRCSKDKARQTDENSKTGLAEKAGWRGSLCERRRFCFPVSSVWQSLSGTDGRFYLHQPDWNGLDRLFADGFVGRHFYRPLIITKAILDKSGILKVLKKHADLYRFVSAAYDGRITGCCIASVAAAARRRCVPRTVLYSGPGLLGRGIVDLKAFWPRSTQL